VQRGGPCWGARPRPTREGNRHAQTTITPSTSETLRVDTNGSNFFDTTLNVYRQDGGGFGRLAFLGCLGFGNSATIDVQGGKTYYVQAGNVYGGAGTMQLNVQQIPPPANDDFANASHVASLPFSDNIDATGATAEIGEP